MGSPRIWQALAPIAILLAGCVTDADKEAASNAWGDCVWAAVGRMDDGKTDPMSLAYGIAPMCGVQYQRFNTTMVDGMITENGQAYMRNLMKEQELRTVTSAILIHRSGGKSFSPPKG